jgi:hypothetical protein
LGLFDAIIVAFSNANLKDKSLAGSFGRSDSSIFGDIDIKSGRYFDNSVFL